MTTSRGLLIPPFAVLFLLLACGGDSGAARTTPERVASPSAAISTPAPDARPDEHVLYAVRLLEAYYVDVLDAHALLRTAWTGAQQATTGVSAPSRTVLDLPADRAGAERAFAAAVQAFLAANPGAGPAEVTLAAIEALTGSLKDNHTYFMQPEEYDLYITNQTVGLGYSGLRRADGLLVWYVYEDGAAARAGLRAGDVIAAIDGASTARRPDDRTADPFRAGIDVRLSVSRPGITLPLEIAATPQRTERRVLDWRRVGDVGYLRLYRFPPLQTAMPDGQTLPAYLSRAIAELRAEGVKAWVLDLRNNPGGSEITAANVAGKLGLKGPLVENRRRVGAGATIDAIGEAELGGLPLAVLTNENSASSTELLTEALQQAGVARVFGAKTAGVVNTARIWAVAGGGLFITTDRAFAGASRRYLDGEGVYPDEAVTLSAPELALGRDTQLERALHWLRSRTEGAATGR